MRTYPLNSPEAAARIAALAMLADGHVCRSEMVALDALQASSHLQLTQPALHGVLKGVSEDLLASVGGDWSSACRLDAPTFDALLDEISDPALRVRTLALCHQLAQADAHCTPDEQILLEHVRERWSQPAQTA
ncbi:MAG: TerB family tellurite resistance protein [Burkholderiaceae bacterium]|jgi:uncharacterized tellurite resistance protein B-like protein|nr:TerB family tellurite resistance protein [Burkholderiaceae bacterium]MCO5105211.1 TerB family tellurite resistance protein [Burkholderiaceae bacterium]